MKVIVTFILLVIPFLSNAQYESILGQNSTEWTFQWNNLFGNFQDTIFIEKDTTLQNHVWKKILCNNCQGLYKGGLIREDTTIGKVWYKALPDINLSVDTNIQLICDISLQIGDSFDISGAWGGSHLSNSFGIVDSVYYIDSLKHISFNYGGYSIPFFVESIGSIVGILYKQDPTLMRDQSLLCVYKDNIPSYNNPHHPCAIISSISHTHNSPLLSISPSPFYDQINIRYHDFSEIKNIRIYNMMGMLIYSSDTPKSTIKLDIMSGLYLIQIKTIHDNIITKKIIKR